MTHETLLIASLRALHDLARRDCPATAALLADRLGVSPIRLAEGLHHLERKGLVDAGQVRLTMQGLMIARSLDAALRRESEHRAASVAA